MQALPAELGPDAPALRAQLQGRMLASDMSAFKAANPGCCLLGEQTQRLLLLRACWLG